MGPRQTGGIDMFRVIARVLGLLAVSACTASGADGQNPDDVFEIREIASFQHPWAMSFLPDGRLLVTEKEGRLFVVSATGERSAVTGVPDVDYGVQGGLGDVIPHPEFSTNHIVYLSYVEAGDDSTRGAAVARAELHLQATGGGRLGNLTVIWRQTPKVAGRGHFGHRLAFDSQGYLFVSSGERQKFSPAQDMQQNLGKIIRLRDDGAIPPDNPFAAQGGVAAQIWSLGQRNPLGIAFAADGELWEIEMGPAGGDELNLISRGTNYGYPTVSNGNHYSGADIPDHHTRPEFAPLVVWWTPVISPADLMIYEADLFPGWRGNAFVAGLSSRSLVRIEFTGASSRDAERYAMGERIRAVRQGPEGAIYLLEDGADGRLLRLTPIS